MTIRVEVQPHGFTGKSVCTKCDRRIVYENMTWQEFNWWGQLNALAVLCPDCERARDRRYVEGEGL